MPLPTTQVYRRQVLAGVAIPAVIHNGSYFFANLDVYEDGRVNCWNFEDFASFQQDVRRGWVALHVPDGQALSIYGLGSWVLTGGQWQFTPESFIEYVASLVRELNPGTANLYTYHEKKVGGISVGELGNGTVFKKEAGRPDYFAKKVDGDSVNLFYKTATDFRLVRASVFADGTLALSRLEPPLTLTFEELEQLVAAGTVLTDIPAAAPVTIEGLGSFTAQRSQYVVAIADKVAELRDLHRELNGGLTAVQACRLAYEHYQASPTAENRAKLQSAYEAVPHHQRMFVGDMDTKDVAVRMIIYGEQEIENWSHYQAAKSLGGPLPSITIPKPAAE